ncbi:nucleotide exchange factor GrpE [Polluticaenibacter yanchengensis]|uniref:Protein GrpE n=1 Tax=Polluticaenibacter yanchengensis TaxID=3014562 RepID=A0ABT4UIV7_9BACT|nr:nucleotide exchange factor GrpE [Chitinophagaceae bacterium LY-5]
MAEKDSTIQNENNDNISESTEMNINADENMPVQNEELVNESAGNGEQTETDKIKAELEEQKDKYLRLYADFENFKRRTAKERIEYMQTAGKEVITSLLDILDDADRAEKGVDPIINAETESALSGIKLVFQKLRQNLESKGLKAMVSVGESFDVDKHEAIAEIPAPAPDLEGKIIDEVTKGYTLNDKIIRFAKVVVAK